MDTTIKKYLEALSFEKLQQHKNMGVIPILCSLNHSPQYLTLKEALEVQALIVTEIDKGGSVPELKVVNKGETGVLLLDGEELVGAKQNRVLNTTILIKENSETVIPVSCTEQGRWSYTSESFSDSDTVMTTSARIAKVRSVSKSLDATTRYDSDQGEVWDQIEGLTDAARVETSTGAMRDVYEAKKLDLDAYLKAFACLPQQKGLLVYIDGDIVGFDFVSYEKAFAKVHGKLVKSYAMEAMLKDKKDEAAPELMKAKDFLREALACKEKKFKSVGRGWDLRFDGEAVVGSALRFRNKVIHTAFFRVSESDKAGRMAGIGRRRAFRTV